DQARAMLDGIPRHWSRYVEIAPGPDLASTLDLVAEFGGFAKLRTGGTDPTAIPSAEAVLGFLKETAARPLAFKATAGLHHALRGTYPLTYAVNPPRAQLFGYLNLALAAALTWTQRIAEASDALLEQDPASIRVTESRLIWNERQFDVGEITALRQDF